MPTKRNPVPKDPAPKAEGMPELRGRRPAMDEFLRKVNGSPRYRFDQIEKRMLGAAAEKAAEKAKKR